MSVYRQAVLDGRISPAECRSRPQVKRGEPTGETVYSVTRRALRAIKQEEAQHRALGVELGQTKAYRRQLAGDLARAASKRKVAKP